MLTTAGDTEDAEGSREDAERRATMHGDNRGRIAMGSFRKSPPPDADKPIILTPSEGGLHVRPCPSARPSCVVRCALFPLSRTPRQHANSVNVPGNTCLRPTVSLVNTVNLGMLEGREAPLPPAGLQPEDSGRPLILPAAYGEANGRCTLHREPLGLAGDRHQPWPWCAPSAGSGWSELDAPYMVVVTPIKT